MPDDLKITTEMLFQGVLIFALMDAVYVPLLAWRVREGRFRQLKWPLLLAAGLIWYGIWSWAIGNFWESVYRYVFPAWAERWIPLIAGPVAAAVACGLWALALRYGRNPVLAYCLGGGLAGVITHIWAVYRGVVEKPPMLRGASPWGAVTFAFFEYIFYWCTILVLANLMRWAWARARKMYEGTGGRAG